MPRSSQAVLYRRRQLQLRLLALAALAACAAAAGVPGLKWSRYDGNVGGSVPFSTGLASASGTSAAIDLDTLPGLPASGSLYGVVWRGFFVPQSPGTWCFRSVSDDVAGVWIGAAAVSPTSSNAVARSTSWSNSWNTGCTTLYAGVWYAITVQYAQFGSLAAMRLQFGLGSAFSGFPYSSGTDGTVSRAYYTDLNAPPGPGLMWKMYPVNPNGVPFSLTAAALGGFTPAVDLTQPGIPSNNFAMEWTGYFLPSATGTWSFRCIARWGHGFWTGMAAVTPTSSNALIYSNGWTGGYQTGSLSMTAGVYLRLRIQMYAVGGSNYGIYFLEYTQVRALIIGTACAMSTAH